MTFKGAWKWATSCPRWCSEAYAMNFWKSDRTRTNVTMYRFVLNTQPSLANVWPLKATFGVFFKISTQLGSGEDQALLKLGAGTSFKSSLIPFHVTSVQFNKPGWLIPQRYHKWAGRLQIYRLHMELTVGFHESLTCLTVCGQDRVCAAESIWTEGGKSGLEETTTGPGCRTHIHFAWWTCTHWFCQVYWSQSCSSFGDGVVDLAEPCDSMKRKLDKGHLLASHVLALGLWNTAEVVSVVVSDTGKHLCSGF